MATDDSIRVSVFLRSGQDVYQMQYRDPITARKVRRSTGTRNQRSAERIAGKWEKDLQEGKVVSNGRIAWNKFRDMYEDQAVEALAATTAKRIDSVLNTVEKILSPSKLGNLTRDAFDLYAKDLRRRGRSEATIKSHFAHIRAMLSWAVEKSLLGRVPTFPKLHRAKKRKAMRGRPITTEEYERMIESVSAIIRKPNLGRSKNKPPTDWDRVPGWRRLLEGLWWSGLRISEALDLHWTDESKILVELSYQRPMLRIPAEKEKGHKDRLLPMAPEFAEFLLRTPESRRNGYVFDPRPMRKRAGRLGEQQVIRTIAEIGKKAKVVVDTTGKVDPESGERIKRFATAHDLRRSFGLRWAGRVMPQILMELMRHESIETTMRYYIGRNAEATAEVLWAAIEDGRTQRRTQGEPRTRKHASKKVAGSRKKTAK